MIGDGVAALQVEVARGEVLPGTEEQFESVLRPATVARLSLSETVRASLVLPYALEVRFESPDPLAPTAPARRKTSQDGERQPTDDARTPTHQLAVLVRNDPDAPVPYLRFAISGVTPAHRLASADDDLTLELLPGEYFVELRRGASWEEIGHPVLLNRVSYFTERQAAERAASPA